MPTRIDATTMKRLKRLREVQHAATLAVSEGEQTIGRARYILKNLDRLFAMMLEHNDPGLLEETARIAYDLRHTMLQWPAAAEKLGLAMERALTPADGEAETDLDWLVKDEAERRRQAEEAERNLRPRPENPR